jgi:excisionase family DNA binding protein
MATPSVDVLVNAVAVEVASKVLSMLKEEISQLRQVQPTLFTVKQAAVYLGRSESSIEQLIFKKTLPVVRLGGRVHLDRRQLDKLIEENTY